MSSHTPEDGPPADVWAQIGPQIGPQVGPRADTPVSSTRSAAGLPRPGAAAYPAMAPPVPAAPGASGTSAPLWGGYQSSPFQSQEDPNSRSLGIAALICCILPIPLSIIAGVVMAFVVLSRGRQRAGRGRGLAIGALAAAGVWVLVVAAVVIVAVASDAERTNGTVTSSGRVLTTSLRAGDCFTLPKGEQVMTVTVQPCPTPHDAEVFADFELDPGPYPGDRLVTGAAEGGCIDRWEAFIGTPYDESTLDLYYFIPTKATWSDRTVICSAMQDGVRTSGTLRQSAR